MAKRAVFIDRDGTLNEECGYLHRVEMCRFIPRAIEAVALLNGAGFQVVVVTNQSGIARGYYTEADMENLHAFMAEQMQGGGARVDAWYFCPHHPDFQSPADDCLCRKPLPGMLLQAAADLEIDLSSSWMVGDKLADVIAGNSAGCRSILVLTGYGREESALAGSGTQICDDLYDAARYILAATTEV